MKLKFIAAALGLVASASSFATINPSGTVGGGELFLVVYEQGAKNAAGVAMPDQSFTLDLGISTSQLLASNTVSQTWATLTSADATWANFLATSDVASLHYSVLGANSTPYSVFGSVTVGQEALIAGTVTGNSLVQAVGALNGYALNVSQTGTHLTQANGESVNLLGSGAYFMDNTQSMNTVNLKLWQNDNLVGTTAEMTSLTRAVGNGALKATEVVMPGTLSFANTANGYVLNYTAVPEPEGLTLALAGFGIMGFLGARRRKQ